MGKKKDLPAMPFYFGDWRKAPEVRALDLATRMIWFEMLGYMWESTERGYLTLNNNPVITPVITRMIGVDIKVLEDALQQMEQFEVFSRREDGAIYCRKMVRDEEIRKAKSIAGQQGMKKRWGKNKPPNSVITKPITPPENEIESTVLSTSIKSTYTSTQVEKFEKFNKWLAYHAPRVQKMKVPFNPASYESCMTFLVKEFSGNEKLAKEKMSELLVNMHNRSDLHKKNMDANLTVRNWYRMEKERKNGRSTPIVEEKTISPAAPANL